MRYKNIICKYCGRSVAVSTLRKADYCDNCKALAHNESARNCYKKNVSAKEVMQGQEVFENLINRSQPVVRRVSSDGADNMYQKEITELANRYDSLRLDTIRLYKKLKNKKDYLTKTGDIFVHSLEFNGDNMSDNEILEKAKQTIIDRKIRRGCKLSEQTVYEIMRSLGLRSASKFVDKAMNGARTTRDFTQFLESLKDDEEIYANRLSSKSEHKKEIK